MTKITILGAGAWGVALAQVLSSGHDVTIWGRDVDKITHLKHNLLHNSLENIRLSENIYWTSNITEALKGVEILIVSIPTQHCRSVIEQYKELLPKNLPIIQTAKGIEIKTGLLTPQIIADQLPDNPIFLLSGPGFASDLAALKPMAASLSAFAKGQAIIKDIQNIFLNTPLRPYQQNDIMGVALGGALKNILAIAAGFCIGHNLGEGAKAAIITRGFNEMMRLAQAFKADVKTLYGLSGLGDLMLTANSMVSRNYQYGYMLGQEEQMSSSVTVEGFHTLLALEKKISLNPQEFPIFSALRHLIQQKKSKSEIISELLDRPFKQEISLW